MHHKIFLSLNKHTGKKIWIYIQIIAAIGILAYIACALPFVGYCLGISSLGDITTDLDFSCYNGFIVFSSQSFEYYFAGLLFGIAPAKFFNLLFNLGDNYRQGLIYANIGLGHWYDPNGKLKLEDPLVNN